MKWSYPVKARRPLGFIEPCIPTIASKVPEGPLWLHEIKHDGYRLIARKSGDRVRLITRRGFDWSDRYPLIIEAAKKIKGAFLIDGEAVVSDERGIADFQQLHSREYDKSAMLWAFDLLEMNGEDLRHLTLDERKSKLGKLLKTSRRSGIALNEHLETDGAKAFAHACLLGLEGIVSKRRDSRYVSGRSKTWIKIKNPSCAGSAEPPYYGPVDRLVRSQRHSPSIYTQKTMLGHFCLHATPCAQLIMACLRRQRCKYRRRFFGR